MVPQLMKPRESHNATLLKTDAAKASGGFSMMLPTSLAANKSTTKKTGGINFAFAPISVTRRPLSADAKKEAKKSTFVPAKASISTTTVAATAALVSSSSSSSSSSDQKENVVARAGTFSTGGDFFQMDYRDEYDPARANSYEAFCEERIAREQLKKVKRDLERRQREKDEEVTT